MNVLEIIAADLLDAMVVNAAATVTLTAALFTCLLWPYHIDKMLVNWNGLLSQSCD